jgi:hypothetical protein
MKKSQTSESNSSRLEALVKENTFIKEKLVEAEEEKKKLQQVSRKLNWLQVQRLYSQSPLRHAHL